MQRKLFGRTGIVGRRFIMSNEETRDFYANAKSLLMRRNIRKRRRMVAQVSSQARFTIEKDLGFKVFGPGELAKATDVERAVQSIVRNADVQKDRTNKKPNLLTGLLPEEYKTLDSPFFQFILQQDILASVAEYLGIVPILSNVDVWYSINAQTNAPSSSFHCDWAERTQVKVFLYASDVSERNGAVMVMDAEASRRVRERLNYKFDQYIDDEQAYSIVGRQHAQQVTGPSGTVAFADVSRCFHFGSRVTSDAQPRAVAIFQYVTPTSFRLPVAGPRQGPYRHLADQRLTPLQRAVLGAG